MTSLLKIEGLSKSYGLLAVVQDLSFEVSAGSVLGILGPNGAGKTTLFNLISGDVRPDKGKIIFSSQDISLAKPSQRCRLGLGRSYQIPQPFHSMTVLENLLVAACFGASLAEKEAEPVAVEILRTTGLMAFANLPAGQLSLLNRKRLELARALATQPKLLLLDEIAGGLTDEEAKVLVELLLTIKSQGMTMLWVEHVVHALLALADSLLVLNFGVKLAEGEPQAVMQSAEVQRVYMGIDIDS
ncbi:MAG: ABC transporter ATP-binding protein [Gammaproteobacteria bacterium]|nr:ABC transporter ATP-binding protein [Gammaproteobacteria bacterium]